jgi:pyridinium-3,5-bisthiocarboxylic acid mononucleotide nickel chelatase
VQARTFTEVATPYGNVRIKVTSEGSYAPEYEDCRKLAAQSGVALKHIIAEANYAYLNQSR